jgi:GTPase SAR1 family protein
MLLMEGPDGAGKTTLLERVLDQWDDVVRQPRFSTPDGPLPNLFARAWDDAAVMHTHPIGAYDRHPTWSEYVYGPIRGTVDPAFFTSTAQSLVHRVAKHTLTVLCLPPFEVVDHNCRTSYQMEGVAKHTARMYQGYQVQRVFWPGPVVWYDYTNPDHLASVMSRIGLHIAEWQRDHA